MQAISPAASPGDSRGVGSVLGWQQPNKSSVMKKRDDKTLGCAILGYTNREQEIGAQMDFVLEVCERELTASIQFSELPGVFRSVGWVWLCCPACVPPTSSGLGGGSGAWNRRCRSSWAVERFLVE